MKLRRFSEEQIIGILKEQGSWCADGGCDFVPANP